MTCVTDEIAFSCCRRKGIPEPVLLVAEHPLAVQCPAFELMMIDLPVEADREQPVCVWHEVNIRDTAVVYIPVRLTAGRLGEGGKDRTPI